VRRNQTVEAEATRRGQVVEALADGPDRFLAVADRVAPGSDVEAPDQPDP
jgi:hypothetical protein